MAHYTGKDLYIEWRGVDLTTQAQYRSLTVDNTIDTVEVSAGNDPDKSFLTTLRDATITLSFVDDTNAHGGTVRRAFAIGNYGTLVYGPEGTETGMPKFECACWVTGVPQPIEYATEVTREISLQKNGEWIANNDLDETDVF
jgi:hypothetical protein